jgi:hypothetical protein
VSKRCVVCGKQRASEAEHDFAEAEPYAKHPVRCWDWCDEDCWEDEGGGDSIMVLVRRFRERFETAEQDALQVAAWAAARLNAMTPGADPWTADDVLTCARMESEKGGGR